MGGLLTGAVCYHTHVRSAKRARPTIQVCSGIVRTSATVLSKAPTYALAPGQICLTDSLQVRTLRVDALVRTLVVSEGSSRADPTRRGVALHWIEHSKRAGILLNGCYLIFACNLQMRFRRLRVFSPQAFAFHARCDHNMSSYEDRRFIGRIQA